MDFHYSLAVWLLFFYIYCFIGWCIESTYVSIHKKKFVNRGFMRGPFLPLYGSGAVIMLFATIPFRDNIALTFLVGALAASVLEYITGACMEALFKVRYWDYSKNPFNIHGYVCLGTTIAWGFLTIVLVDFIHAPIEELVLSLNTTAASVIATVLTVYMASDFALSFKAALDIRDILDKMTKAKEELAKVQTRLDGIIAFSDPRFAEQTGEVRARDKVSELLSDIKEKLDLIKQNESSGEGTWRDSLDKYREEIENLREKYIVAKDKRNSVKDRLGFYAKDMLKGHPTISSRKFSEALTELKETAEERKVKSGKKDKKK